jgi:membrane-bound lytic murein transglycosylase B
MKFSANTSLIFIAAILLAACGAKSSDEEQVRALIDSVEAAAEARDASDVLDHVADDYADSSGLDRPQLQNFLRGYFLAHPKLELVVNIESLEFPVDGLAQAVVSVATVELGDPDLQRLKIELRRVDGEWRVARADRISR